MSLTKRIPEIVGVLALVLAGGCDSLTIANPNAPDTPHLLANPASILTVAQGAMKTWYLTTQGGLGEDQYPALTLAVMSRSHTAMWNNFHIRFYTGCTDGTQAGAPLPWNGYTAATFGTCGPKTEGPYYPRHEWQNNSGAAERTQIEALWYGYYSSLSSARDVLTRIRVDHVLITDAKTTKMVETMTVLAQALSLSGIAVNYDHGYVVDYTTDLLTLQFSPAAEVLDSAMLKFDEAIALATATGSFTSTADGFFGPGVTYTNVQIAQIANTMAARTLAYFPRNAAQNATVDWARVAGYASKGISSGAPFDLVFHQDACNTWCDFLKVWTNDMTTVRVHTRVAHLMDPVTQPDPWDATLNTNPKSPDKRLGDGTYRGATDTTNKFLTGVLNAYPDTSGSGGTDFVWTHTKEFGNKTRGSWHQSAIGQIRYDTLPGCGDNPQGSSSPGNLDTPMVLAAENDLIWAEALIRGPTPNLAQAATLINNTRVGRGGLTPSAGTLADLQYEQDVELLGSNNAPYYNQRRIDNLEPFTPHEMPVPAKELGVIGRSIYTCGGAAHPDGSCDAFPLPAATGMAANLVASAPKVWAQLEREWHARAQLNSILNSRR
jgi:hypothetical protein